MKQANKKQSSPTPLANSTENQKELPNSGVASPSPIIEILGLDSNISFHGTLINKFTSNEYTISETQKGENTWFQIQNDRLTLFVPIHRVSYIVYQSVKQ